jgi:hypothetical protein
VRYIWPDMGSPRGQIQFSALVTALILREMVAVVRWVLKDQSEPVLGVCIPEQDFPDTGKRLDYMFWIKVGCVWPWPITSREVFLADKISCHLQRMSTISGSHRLTRTEQPLVRC